MRFPLGANVTLFIKVQPPGQIETREMTRLDSYLWEKPERERLASDEVAVSNMRDDLVAARAGSIPSSLLELLQTMRELRIPEHLPNPAGEVTVKEVMPERFHPTDFTASQNSIMLCAVHATWPFPTRKRHALSSGSQVSAYLRP